MNNSDIIAALSLAVTAIIFLVQTDDGLLRLKMRKQEKWIVAGLLLIIVLLTNHQIFERFGVDFNFTFFGKYLLPTEWALIIFLYLLGVTLYRIFSSKLFIKNPDVVFDLIEKYRRDKKWSKLQNLLFQVIDIKEFESDYAERLNDTIFNDHHLIELFASNSPELLIKFSNTYKAASINRAEHFYYILNGLFADKSNPIFAEIRHYRNDENKRLFMEEIRNLKYDTEFEFELQRDYRTELPIISWLSGILDSFPVSLKEEAKYFFRQFNEVGVARNNEHLYSEEEILRLLSRDTIFNVIQLFRILLIEFSFNNKKSLMLIARILPLLYSSWDFIKSATVLKTENKVALNNDSYTINEYFIKYLFNSYLAIYFLLHYIKPYRIKNGNNNHDSSDWPLKQLFAKMDGLIGEGGLVSDRTKQYYMSKFVEFYFEMDEYFNNETIVTELRESILFYLKDSLNATPFGDVDLIRMNFKSTLDSFDFVQFDSPSDFELKNKFYSELMPFSEESKWRIFL